MTRVRALFGLAGVAVAAGLWLAFTAPTDVLQGEYSRFISLHVPSLWIAFVAFGVTAFGSVAWLIRRKHLWDRLAAASAEIGVLFTGIGLFTGMVWGQAVWGQAWDWGDARLSTTAIMFFVYLGYLALRRASPDPVTRARRAAILGAVAVIQIPLVYFSVTLFRTLHQTPSIRPDGSSMPGEMLVAMGVNVLAFTILYVALMVARMGIAKLETNRGQESAHAGEGIAAPRLSEIEDV